MKMMVAARAAIAESMVMSVALPFRSVEPVHLSVGVDIGLM